MKVARFRVESPGLKVIIMQCRQSSERAGKQLISSTFG